MEWDRINLQLDKINIPTLCVYLDGTCNLLHFFPVEKKF